mmetsp:Transcript_8715/g.17925  ORF Transcript_8715/g.17925 Transcript_8715/m.17925 type:complete len:349 (+) Transcript_8715:254-1300(+)
MARKAQPDRPAPPKGQRPPTRRHRPQKEGPRRLRGGSGGDEEHAGGDQGDGGGAARAGARAGRTAGHDRQRGRSGGAHLAGRGRGQPRGVSLSRAPRGRKRRRRRAAIAARPPLQAHVRASRRQAPHARRPPLAHRRLRAPARPERRGPSGLLPQKRRSPPQPGPHQLRHRLPPQEGLSGPPAAVHDEQGGHGGHRPVGGFRRTAVQSVGQDGRSRGGQREVPHRHVGTAHLRISQERVDRGEDAPIAVRGDQHVFQEGGGQFGKGYPGYFQGASVREDRAILRRQGRFRGVGERAKPDDRRGQGVLRESGVSVSGGMHRVRGAQRRGGQEVRFGGVVSGTAGVQGAG